MILQKIFWIKSLKSQKPKLETKKKITDPKNPKAKRFLKFIFLLNEYRLKATINNDK